MDITVKAMNTIVKRLGVALAVAAPALALAHTGAGGAHTHANFASGLLHPLGGADHLAAMVAVGVWSALAVRPVWVAPLAFVAMLVLGALAAFAGWQVPAVEPMIAASLLAVGLLVALRVRLPAAAAVALTGAFAFFHGAAHGTELAGGPGAWPVLAGMTLGTALLHAAGIGLGEWVLRRRRWLGALAGAAVALLGSALLLRMAL